MSEELNTIGSRLKQARLQKGVSLEEVYKKTKIHVNILSAIEADKLQDFSATYMKGFLKIYAQYLGLNTKEIIGQYQDKIALKDEVVLKSDIPRAKINISLFKPKIQLGFKVLIIICIVFILGKMISISRANKKISAERKIEVTKKNIASPIKKKTGPIKLAIRAKEDSWIQLVCDGKKIFEGILKKGMKESWNAKNEIKLSVGNAGGLEIEVNDKILSPLGRSGQALKDIIITAEGVSTGRVR